jgi:hypothetical protein
MVYPANYVATAWTPREPVTSTKLQQMSDNIAGLQTAVDAAPRGLLARTMIKNTQSSTAQWWDIQGLTATASVEAHRWIRASVVWQGLLPWGNPGVWSLQLANVTLNDKTVAQAYIDCTTDKLYTGGGSLFSTGFSTVAQSFTWKVRLYRLNGAGNSGGSIIFSAGDNGPAQLVIEDLGSTL